MVKKITSLISVIGVVLIGAGSLVAMSKFSEMKDFLLFLEPYFLPVGVGILIFMLSTLFTGLAVIFFEGDETLEEEVLKNDNDSLLQKEREARKILQPEPTPKSEQIAEKIEEVPKAAKEDATPKPVVSKAPQAPPSAAYQILAMFQKEGRLLDFLMEDISQVDDESLGGAIRPIHEGCKKILQERLVLEPVIKENEGEEIKIDDPVDVHVIKLTGNVPPAPPFKGVVVHKGWKLKECKLPELVSGWSGNVVAPAEVEIQ